MLEDNLEGSRRVARQVVESVGRFACAPQRGFPECTRRHAFGLPKHTAAQTTQPVYDSDPSRSLVIWARAGAGRREGAAAWSASCCTPTAAVPSRRGQNGSQPLLREREAPLTQEGSRSRGNPVQALTPRHHRVLSFFSCRSTPQPPISASSLAHTAPRARVGLQAEGRRAFLALSEPALRRCTRPRKSVSDRM